MGELGFGVEETVEEGGVGVAVCGNGVRFHVVKDGEDGLFLVGWGKGVVV